MYSIFIAALFTIARTWKQPRCPLTDEWIKRLWYIYTMDYSVQFSSVHFSRPVVSDSLQPHESQHARPPCPSPTLRVYPNPWPSSQWCHPAISSSVVPFSSCPQSLPASGSFPVSQLFSWVKVLAFQLRPYFSFKIRRKENEALVWIKCLNI